LSTHGNDALRQLGPPSAAVQALLRKVADLCVLAQVSRDAAEKMFREAYAAAESHAKIQPQSQLAGDTDPFIAAQVLSEWHQNSAFLDRDGNPSSLSISGGEFAKLCAIASVQVDPDKTLDLLSQAGVVSVDNDRVSAKRRELIMDYAHPAAVTRAIRLSAEFASTLHHNLSRNVREPGLFERAVVSTTLARRQIPSLLAFLSVHGQSFLEDLDAWMAARDSSTPGPSVGVGVYLFVGADET
jgi:hypothetical protein